MTVAADGTVTARGRWLAGVSRQLRLPIASTAPLAKITERFAAAFHRYSRNQQVPWVDFLNRQRKNEVVHQYQAAFEATGRNERHHQELVRSTTHRAPPVCQGTSPDATASPSTGGSCVGSVRTNFLEVNLAPMAGQIRPRGDATISK